MKIGFIGAGKVGFSLGKFFAMGGVPVTGYYSRRRESAREAAQFTGTKAYDVPGELVQASDALFLTVPDGAIPTVFQSLGALEIAGKIFCHCSGAMTVEEAFPGLAGTGAFGYSIHPLFPISDKLNSYGELADAFFCLEGEGPHIPQWQALFTSLGASVQVISGASKARYHAACSIASNLVCALLAESLELLRDCGFSPEAALRAVSPLARSNMAHILQDGPVAALTGPVERGDAGTVKKHLACLPEGAERELYRLASLKLLELAACKNPERDYRPLENLLEGSAMSHGKEYRSHPAGDEAEG